MSATLPKAEPNQKWAIFLFTIGVFMAALDNGIISAALTTINKSFQVSPSWGAWGITLYTLGLAVSVPIVGKLSDRYGRKKLFIAEVTLFGIGSLLVAISQSFPMFLLARLIQSLGGGGIFIIGSSHVLTVLPKEKQGTALGLLGAMNGIAAVLGPNIGSFILDIAGSWHWLFLINLPIAAGLVLFSFPLISETKADQIKPLDLTGTVILSLAILSVMYGIPANSFAGGEANALQLKEKLSQIPDPNIKQIITDAIQESIGTGFGKLYLAAAVMSIIVIGAITILSAYRNKQARRDM
ncbi:MFS transporter [Bacillus sonorensis]|uniref:MFS transporter n=1 Tax=Bacillus sonorensis TaxID=119858 RepID=UPI0004979CFC|nr:MFS transporter [Bacillus sonorensis]MEC1588933.1 MFS transporter [Bacillus sonorensis]